MQQFLINDEMQGLRSSKQASGEEDAKDTLDDPVLSSCRGHEGGGGRWRETHQREEPSVPVTSRKS